MPNIFREEVSKGNAVTVRIAFRDSAGYPFDLTGWEFSMAFKEAYNSDANLFLLSWGTQIGFYGEDPKTGVVEFRIEETDTDQVTIDLYTSAGEVPYKEIRGDVKIKPPEDYELHVGGMRPTVLLTVYGVIT